MSNTGKFKLKVNHSGREQPFSPPKTGAATAVPATLMALALHFYNYYTEQFCKALTSKT